MNYENLVKIFNYITAHKQKFEDFEVALSLPTRYLKEKNQEKLYYPLKDQDDLFPYRYFCIINNYRDGTNAFWTGFYTTRSYLKG